MTDNRGPAHLASSGPPDPARDPPNLRAPAASSSATPPRRREALPWPTPTPGCCWCWISTKPWFGRTTGRTPTCPPTSSGERCVARIDPETYLQTPLKDLRKVARLGFDLRRTLIVDDSPEKVRRHYGNAVYVRPWTGDPADDELPRLLRYLHTLADVADVRRIEKRRWRTGLS